MKRAAAVAGFLEIGDGTCRLQLANVSLVKTTSTSSRTRQTTTTVSPPSPHSLLDQVATGTILAHETKMSLSLRQLQSHMCYLPAKLSLPTGVSGGWTDEAQQLLLRWFAAPKKGAKKPLAIQDAEQPSSSKKLAIQDVEQPSSSETLASKDVDQPATEDVDNPPEAAVDTNADECTSSSSSSSSSSSALPVVDTMGWDSQWHDIWQQTTALDRRCSGSKSGRRR